MSTASSRPRSLKRLSLLQSPTSLSSPSSSSFGSPDLALRHVDFSLPDEVNGTGAQPSPISSVSSPTSATRPVNGTLRKNARRQSSIYYVSQDRESERVVRDVRSPANERRFSTLQKQLPKDDAESDVKAKRRSLVGTEEQAAPVTLVGKHAVLLHFIAQKESRCLEIRSQLATEEAELLTLKRKWEQIVSRQVKRSSSASVSSSLDAETTMQSNMLSGIKEGVQEVGRLLAQLGDLGVQNKETDPSAGHASNSSISTTTTTTSASSTRLSQSSMSSLGMAEDEVPPDHTNTVSDILDLPAKRHSLSTAVRRKPYEPSSPSSPSPPILTPQTPLSASPFSYNQAYSSKPSRSESTDTVKAHTQTKHRKRLSAANAGSFPPASSIPGVNVAPLASWVEGVGKRLVSQVTSSSSATSYSASAKRTSIRFSEGASSLFSSLTSPTQASQAQANPRVIDLSMPNSPSLLDDDDMLGEGSDTQWADMPTLSPERPRLSPVPISTLSKAHAAPVGTTAKPWSKENDEVAQSDDDDSEEWNW
ncbi:hypothetical protein ACEPAI_3119 [Sanghuangporus weigelae]